MAALSAPRGKVLSVLQISRARSRRRRKQSHASAEGECGEVGRGLPLARRRGALQELEAQMRMSGPRALERT